MKKLKIKLKLKNVNNAKNINLKEPIIANNAINAL